MLGIDKIFAINLKRRRDRLGNFFSTLPFDKNLVEVFSAVDGKKTLPKDNILDLYNSEFFRFSCGEVGVALSHLFIWKKIIEYGYQKTLILEDDAFFFEGAIDKWNDKYHKYLLDTKDFHICYLGRTEKNSNKINFSNINKYFSRNVVSQYTFGAFAYIITISGAELLCKKIEGFGKGVEIRRKMRSPIDYIINTYLDPNKMLTCNDLLVFSPCFYKTDIQHEYSTIFENNWTLKIMFLDFWSDFNYHDNLFIDIIHQFGNRAIRNNVIGRGDIIVTDDINNCDLLIYSSYGNIHKKYFYFNYVRKIFYCGKNKVMDSQTDLFLNFDKWFFYLDWFSKDSILLDKLCCEKDRQILKNKNKFCSYILPNPKSKINDHFLNDISEEIDQGGFELDSAGRMIESDTKSKMEFLEPYKFNLIIDPENCLVNVLTTYASGCIPIFWSNNRDLNMNELNGFCKESYIDSRNFTSADEFIEFIEKINKDDKLWYQIYNKSPFTKSKEEYYKFLETISKKIISDL